jgi:hypothetical protein
MSIEAMKQWLEALEHGLDYAKSEQFENAQRYKGYENLAPDDAHSIQLIEAAITSLRQAITEAEKQEPVAWIKRSAKGNIIDLLSEPDDDAEPVYTTPQQRKPLTDKQIAKLMDIYDVASLDYARAIEAAHGIKE